MGKHLRGQRYVGGYFSKRLTFTPQKRGFEVYLHFSHQIILAPKSNGAKDSLLHPHSWTSFFLCYEENVNNLYQDDRFYFELHFTAERNKGLMGGYRALPLSVTEWARRHQLLSWWKISHHSQQHDAYDNKASSQSHRFWSLFLLRCLMQTYWCCFWMSGLAIAYN